MTSPSPGRPSDLMFLLSWASHVLRVEHAAGLADLGISPRAHCVLARARVGGLTQRQVGELCGVDKTTMVVTLDQLEIAGLARRVPSPTDRRARLVEVTTEGQRVLGQAQEIAARLEQDVLAALPDDEREVFLRAIRRLVDERLSGDGACGPAGSVC
ncbi:MarR family winged helix-turn-helix transcriptional regulator [Micromonospora sp. WMMD1082]|uniref:MarR family winged helix-turn-helix transcriptional regulator n=1 Tax=Micromonospora sp. WMMD1082 TaxID=3016104 RepID=UPI002415CEB8|nr:MarR family winged helix-turn-helix transcriptional regulator [Micromonospora sp. WMMD1082]MDG4797723.1 MarR family winged helix-turn-helix transcriptional regulator [Micromonospora sp. WMMD1082]